MRVGRVFLCAEVKLGFGGSSVSLKKGFLYWKNHALKIEHQLWPPRSHEPVFPI